MITLGKEPIRVAGSDQIISWVASGGYGYTVQKSIVFTYLPIEYARPGAQLEIECFGENVGAVVEHSPLYDPKGERVRE